MAVRKTINLSSMETFNLRSIKSLVLPQSNSAKGDNGQVTIVAGSALFHGAPLLALTTASRFVDMVYFSSPEKSVGEVAGRLKSKLFSFIWTPWSDLEHYIKKSDVILIGPGLMRFRSEGATEEERLSCDEACRETTRITKKLLTSFPDKKWVIDGGSLQTMETSWIPKGSILTPNKREYKRLFGDMDVASAAKKFDCTIVYKMPETIVCSPDKCIKVGGGNAGLTKGGTGDVQAGLTAALFAKNDAFLAAASASSIVKNAADELYKKVGIAYNADDLSREIPLFFPQFLR